MSFQCFCQGHLEDTQPHFFINTCKFQESYQPRVKTWSTGSGSPWINAPPPFSVGQTVYIALVSTKPRGQQEKPLSHVDSLHLGFIFPSPLLLILRFRPLLCKKFIPVNLQHELCFLGSDSVIDPGQFLKFCKELVLINPSGLILVSLFDKYLCNTYMHHVLF